MKRKNPFIGKWRIIEMELWDQDFIDMETEGYFHFEKNEMGSFHFGAVQGRIDYRVEKIGEHERSNSRGKVKMKWMRLSDADGPW